MMLDSRERKVRKALRMGLSEEQPLERQPNKSSIGERREESNSRCDASGLNRERLEFFDRGSCVSC